MTIWKDWRGCHYKKLGKLKGKMLMYGWLNYVVSWFVASVDLALLDETAKLICAWARTVPRIQFALEELSANACLDFKVGKFNYFDLSVYQKVSVKQDKLIIATKSTLKNICILKSNWINPWLHCSNKCYTVRTWTTDIAGIQLVKNKVIKCRFER